MKLFRRILSAIYSATMIAVRFTVVLLFAIIFAAHIYPLWSIAKKMGYPGVLGVLAVIPGVQLLLAYFLALAEWPVLKGLNRAGRQTVP